LTGLEHRAYMWERKEVYKRVEKKEEVPIGGMWKVPIGQGVRIRDNPLGQRLGSQLSGRKKIA